MNKLRAALLGYRYYCIVPLLLSVIGCGLYMYDHIAVPLLLMKLATDGLIWYFITETRGHQFYYYYNLHVSKIFLFITWLLADLAVFCLLLWLTALIS